MATSNGLPACQTFEFAFGGHGLARTRSDLVDGSDGSLMPVLAAGAAVDATGSVVYEIITRL
jgi:hypothetical protein